MKVKRGSVYLCILAFVTARWRRLNEANAGNVSASPQDPMTIEAGRTNNETAIRELIDHFVKACRATNINGVMRRSGSAGKRISSHTGLRLLP